MVEALMVRMELIKMVIAVVAVEADRFIQQPRLAMVLPTEGKDILGEVQIQLL